MDAQVQVALIGSITSILLAWITQRAAQKPRSSHEAVAPMQRSWIAFVATIGLGLALTSLVLIFLQFRFRNQTWFSAHVDAGGQTVVALVRAHSFVKFEGFTTENEYCQPFTVFVSSTREGEQPVISVVPYGEIHAVSADVTWEISPSGELYCRKGARNAVGIGVVLKPPEVYKGLVSKPRAN